MNKAVIYFGATGNEAADQMVMQVLEEYCAVNGYEVVAVISENARPEGMTFPMKFAFVGMAEVEDVDVVVTLMSDMVKDSTEFDTVDEYKADVKKKLEEANEKHADSEVEAKIFDKVIENMTAEIPQVMFDNRVNEMISELEQRLAPQGISLDLYMQYTGQTIDTVKKAYAEQAEKQVKLRLALEKIAKLENIEVTEDELKAEFDKLAEAYKLDIDQIKQFIHDDDLKKDIAVGKAVDLIKDAAVIK